MHFHRAQPPLQNKKKTEHFFKEETETFKFLRKTEFYKFYGKMA